MLRTYWQLTKPGIIYGNLITAAAGFFLAAQGDIDWLLFVAVCLGVSLIIASGCVFNNYIDRDIDCVMQRTCNRAMVKKLVSARAALVFGTVLGLAGFSTLGFFTSPMALLFGALGFIVYVGFYSLYFKRKSVHGTAVGSISGACPPVIGYCAVTNAFDPGAAIILAAFCLWQIPHSYAIAIYRFEDYKAANIPVLPVTDGIKAARQHIIGYIVAFIVVTLLLPQQEYVGVYYTVCMAALGLVWLYIAVSEYSRMDLDRWARRLFGFSIVIIVSLSILISVDFTQTPELVASLSR